MPRDHFQHQQDNESEKKEEEVIVGGNDQFVPVNRHEQNHSTEETAEELTLDDHSVDDEEIVTDDSEMDVRSSTIIGWSGIVLSVLSFFMLPFILGIAGIVVGFIAKNKEKDRLGNTAIIVGAASIIISMFVLLFR